jgi:hypothetical protein
MINKLLNLFRWKPTLEIERPAYKASEKAEQGFAAYRAARAQRDEQRRKRDEDAAAFSLMTGQGTIFPSVDFGVKDGE